MADRGDKKKEEKKSEKKSDKSDPRSPPDTEPTERTTSRKTSTKPPSPAASSSRAGPSTSLSSSSSSSGVESASQSKRAKLEPEKESSKGLILRPIPKRIESTQRSKKYYLQSSVRIEVNYLRLTYKTWDQKIYHYDVTIQPDKQKTLFRRALHLMQRKHYRTRHPAYDGNKNLYAAGSPLPLGPENSIEDSVEVVDSPDGKRTSTFKVTIKLVASPPLNVQQLVEYTKRGSSQSMPQDVLQATDIALRANLLDRFIPCGRSFFTGSLGCDLGGGYELFGGFFQSAVVAKECFLNIDVSNKGFPTDRPVVEHLTNVMRVRYHELSNGLHHQTKRDLGTFLVGLKVIYAPRGERRIYKVNSLGNDATEHKFQFTNPQGQTSEISVAEYFGRFKRMPLKYPKLPLLQVGSPLRNTMIPLEHCRVLPSQVVMRKLDEKQTAVMVQAAASSTDVRRERISKSIGDAKYDRCDTLTREFGITIDQKLVQVDSHVFKPPQILYRQGSVTPDHGSWRMDRNAFRNTTSNGISRWAILNKDSRVYEDQIRHTFVKLLVDSGHRAGLEVAWPRFILGPNQGRRDGNTEEAVLSDLSYLNQKYGPLQIVVVIMPGGGPGAAHLYSNVKRASELKCGVLTQCVKGITATKKMNPTTAQNILLKMNTKINGVNHELGGPLNPTVLQEPVMFVGADVTHPAPGSTDTPSIAAVAASFDPVGYKYKMLYTLQGCRREMIDDLERIMVNQLEYYRKMNRGQLPAKILYYRDGVSEGQFNQVLNIELNAMQQACRKVSANYMPKITLLIVQKRHHTRFFPRRQDGDRSKNNNVLPGTVVDSIITHPTETDFFLVSHQSIQGTARPTKYHVLWDDNRFECAELEVMTYHLCYLFSRCNRAVSYPAPTYYAHLGAFRARTYWEGRRVNLSRLVEEQKDNGTIREEICRDSPMFFV